MKKRIVGALLAVALLLTGCAGNPESAGTIEPVTVLVTRDFGREILAEKAVVPMEGDTVMDLMMEHFEVETAYGRGFVNAIDGLASGYTDGGGAGGRAKTDWFYYVDGIMAEVGADQIAAADAGHIAWDYHDWGGEMYVKTRIDAWPERFRDRTVQVIAAPAFEQTAEALKASVAAGGGTAVLGGPEGFKPEDLETDALLVGTWEDLAGIPFVREAFENRQKAGVFMAFGEDGLTLYDDRGGETGRFPEGAVLTAVQKAYGADALVLVISGTGPEMVEKAAGLVKRGELPKGAFSLALTKEGIHRAP